MSPAQLSTFSVDGHLFGAEVAVVQEVIRYQPMTRVPLAPAALAGLINLRGQVITAVDLRRRLGFPDRAAGERVQALLAVRGLDDLEPGRVHDPAKDHAHGSRVVEDERAHRSYIGAAARVPEPPASGGSSTAPWTSSESSRVWSSL